MMNFADMMSRLKRPSPPAELPPAALEELREILEALPVARENYLEYRRQMLSSALAMQVLSQKALKLLKANGITDRLILDGQCITPIAAEPGGVPGIYITKVGKDNG